LKIYQGFPLAPRGNLAPLAEVFELDRLDAKILIKARDENYSGYSSTISSELDEKIFFADEEFKSLFRPTKNGLFFAGEHTTVLEYIGTMEAAVESGERVARACKFEI
jgi:hypothetical protein